MILTRRANKSRQVVQLSHRVVVGSLRKMKEEKEKEKDNGGDVLDSKES